MTNNYIQHKDNGSIADQLDISSYKDAVNGTTTWKDHVAQVKSDNPKPPLFCDIIQSMDFLFGFIFGYCCKEVAAYLKKIIYTYTKRMG